MSNLRVLITDYNYPTIENEKRVMEEAGIELITAQCHTPEEVIEAAQDVDGLLVQYAPIPRKVFESLPRLKAVARYGIGFDVIDVDAATEHGVCAINVPDYCEDEVSDHAFALLMSLARKTVLLNNDVKDGGWDPMVAEPIFRLRGSTLGLAGFGKIPRSLASKAKPFGMNVIAYDPFVDEELAREYDTRLVELDDLMKEADFVSVHVPLNKHTRHLISTKEFNLMKETAYIINTARGPIIDEEALIEALKDNQLAGAGLDVLENEPPAEDNPLLEMDNVLITPHSAYYSEQSQVDLQTKTARYLAQALTGTMPKSLLNKEVWKES